MATLIPSYRYPLVCWRKQAEKKLTELALARLEDSCREDRAYATLLSLFVQAITQPTLPYPIAQMRAYSEYLARLGGFLYCPDEEVLEGEEPPRDLSDLYLIPYRDRR